MNMELITIERILVPNLLVYKKIPYKIEWVDKKYFIKKYSITTYKNKLLKLTLDTPHPNCHPTEHDFCLPENFIEMKIDDLNTKKLEILLKTFNLDNSYFRPWDELRFTKK